MIRSYHTSMHGYIITITVSARNSQRTAARHYRMGVFDVSQRAAARHHHMGALDG